MYTFFDFNLINVRGAEKGTKYSTCPICSHERKKKTDKCLAIYFDSGLAKCHHCGALSFKEERKTSQTDKQYVKFDNTWKNYTNLSDKMVKFIRESRMISQNTLNQFQITEEMYFQPAHKKEVNNIVFNYFEGEELVNKKYRSGDKKFTQSKGGKPILYNINSAIGQEEIYIVEGEFDVLAMYEIGIKNVLSLPTGANDNDDYWINSEKYLKDVKKFIIATDNDEKGIEIREKIAQRLGRYRCTYIEFDGKDANDDLKSGKLSTTINNLKRFNIGGTYTAYDMLDNILRLHAQGVPDTISPKKACFGDLKKNFSIMMGQLTTLTGIPSHGKSSFLDWYLLNLVQEYGFKASIYSPEHMPLEMYISKHIRLAIGKPFHGENRVTDTDIYRYTNWSKEKIYYTTQEQNDAGDWDWLFSKMTEQLFTYGINIFVIDAWNKVSMPKGMGGKEGIDAILTRLTMFCQRNNVHIFLVAHPTKMKKIEKSDSYEMPTLYDVSGSSDFKNQTHNGGTVYRVWENKEKGESGYTLFSNQKTKFDFQGEIGSLVKFNYHIPTGRYYVDGSIPDNFDLTLYGNDTEIKEPQEEQITFNLKPNEDFDCPF
jgi:twinkle protein